MQQVEQQKWMKYIADQYPERFLDENIGLVLDEDTILMSQSDASKTTFAIKMQKVLELNISFSRKVEKKFAKRCLPVLLANRVEGMVSELDNGNTLLMCQMVIVGIYDQQQLDQLLLQLNETPLLAKSMLEEEFGY